MLSMLGFQTAPIPFSRKGQSEGQKHSSMSFLSRGKAPQPQQRGSQNGPTYYVFSSSGSYVIESQRPPLGHAGSSSTSVPKGNSQANPAPRPELRASTSSQQVVTTGDSSRPKSTSPGRSFKIYPDTTIPDSFIYERSEVDSDVLTLYSNSSVDTLQFPVAESSTQLTQSSSGARRNSGEPDSPHPLPIPLPSSSSSLVVASQNRPPVRNADNESRARSAPGDSSASTRRNSGSDHERSVTTHPGPSPTRASPPRSVPGGRFPERSNTMPNLPSGPREVPPMRRNSDPTTQGDSARKRRLSGAVIPTGFGVLPGERLSPTSGRESATVVPANLGTTERGPPPAVRGPSPDGKRERYSPEREVSPNSSGITRERRMSGAGVNGFTAPPPGSFYDRDRPAHRRSSQSSASSSSRGHSPQDEAPRGVTFAIGPPAIRSRTISQGRISKDDAPRQIYVAGLETSKMVRFSENLICPSPIPPEKRRKGWFNKRGDQLWTNDGVFVAPDTGTEYPLDLAEYPEPGAGWQNEEGVRIDMQHRLIPKAPLRPALKRGSSSATSQTLPGRPENRVTLNGTSIREEA